MAVNFISVAKDWYTGDKRIGVAGYMRGKDGNILSKEAFRNSVLDTEQRWQINPYIAEEKPAIYA